MAFGYGRDMTQSTDSPENPSTSILRRGMTPTHELMAEWMLQNPGGTLREMGAYFGYSSSWLSQVINSDMFKAYMGDRMKDIQAYVSLDIPEKMKQLADLGIERMREVLEKTEDADVIKDSFDKVMHRYGYAPNARNAIQPEGPKSGATTNNVFFLSPEDHARVKERLINSHAQPAEPQALPAPAQPQPAQPQSEEDDRERTTSDT